MSTSPRVFTLRQAISLYESLPALDGHVVATTTENTKTGEKTTTTKVTPYVLGVDGKGGGKVRWNIAKNMDLLKREYDTFTKARDALILQLANGGTSLSKDDTAAIERLQKETQAMLDNEVTLNGLLNLPLADLNLEGNPELPPSVLAALMPLISEA